MSSQHERWGATNEYIECECGSPRHIIRLTTSDDGTGKWEPTLSVDVQVHHGSFWFRLRNAFLYLFFNDLAQWDGTLLGIEAIEKIERVLLNFKRQHHDWQLRRDNVCLHCEGKGGISECNICGKCATCGSVNEHKPDCVQYRCLP